MTDHQRPEALRAQFEQHMLDNGWSDGELDWRGSHHAYLDIQDAWKLYQAGHAAAKAETADVGPRGISLARELRDQADFDEAESVFGGGSRTRELMREAADALHAGAKEHGE